MTHLYRIVLTAINPNTLVNATKTNGTGLKILIALLLLLTSCTGVKQEKPALVNFEYIKQNKVKTDCVELLNRMQPIYLRVEPGRIEANENARELLRFVCE